MNFSLFVGPHGKPLGIERCVSALDWHLIALLVLMTGFGLVVLQSASITFAESRYGDPFFFLKRQLFAVALGGAIATLIVLRLPVLKFERLALPICLVVLLGLVVVLIPGVGLEVNGAQRWIPLGAMNIQVSEFAKIATALYVASYLMRHGKRLQFSFDAFIKPLILLSLAGVLCLLEPDYGATVVIMTIAVGMIFLGGARVGQFFLCLILLIAVGSLFIYFSDYRMNRVLSFFDPWSDPFDGAFQLVQSLIAVGSGAVIGVGFGGSVQKLLYLPEAHTDFVFAVYAEEMGLIGVTVLVGLYSALIMMMIQVARRAERVNRAFGVFVVYGIVIWVAFQTFISMSVNMGLLPTKGLTLPFLSYGGSSALALSIAFGLVIRIGLEARLNELAESRS